ncbi:GGDEF domain-containing protein [Halomonas beimenensis]|uniref:diguanylate cyclase n=1 Tax=Halomonas beimenensis TaxID=475662 RepID=A0A291P7A0_9GAMM|nr:diguanylate cyclase [Halomonas beimenensis]ATJ82748.1 two-component response regulator, REC and diguanylate cyclase (GGDEF) domain [Halomonas beimenensis]
MSRVTRWLGGALVLLLAGLGTLAAGPAQAEPRDLDQGWEYRWGDSPFLADGTPAWTMPDHDTAWRPIAFPSNPPNRNGRRHAWFRITLPDGEWRDPVLYVYSIDLIAETYLGGERIYRHGSFAPDGSGPFVGWPWHMIELPEDFAGRTLHFRVYSDYTDIGLWGEVKLMERAELFGFILRHSAADLVVSALCLLLALLAGAFSLFQANRRNFAAIALFALAAGVMILAETQASQLLINAPLLWDFLAAGGYFALPVAIGLLLEHWFADHRPRLIRGIWQGHLGYLVLALGAAAAGWVNLSITFPVFDGLLVVSLTILLAAIAPRLRRLDPVQRAILASYAIFGALLLVDMLVAHGLLPWGRVPVSIGALAFALAIVGISLHAYARTQRDLKRLNQHLEQEVAQRTRQLQTLVERLETYSYTDPLTGLHNRRYFDELLVHEATRAQREDAPLALLIFDIDHFKAINDRHGHEAGDRVLAGVAGTLASHFRDADVVCRLGGEEFVVLLPGADAANARSRGESLMNTLGGTVFWHHDRMLGPVTVSCGIAAYPEHVQEPLALVGLADQALYAAKQGGRNRAEVYA